MAPTACKVKICGLRRLEDALVALDEGAWALGLIFHPPSPRFIAPEEAATWVRELPARAFTVGVFVDRPLEEVNDTVAAVGLHAVQLHGRESPEFAAGVVAGEVWKAFRVGDDFDVAAVDDYPPTCRVLLDTYRAHAAGGTGETFDWDVARRVQARRPILLAGGLGPDNVAAAVHRVHPDGVDISSGVEATPGVKDPEKIRRLFAALRRAHAEE